ncbi:hypothetical protein G6F31_016004 [Rhizopus arrhizus]|nr:hypothetical protein G6F31_016004 [Rhizopus arrhizus]
MAPEWHKWSTLDHGQHALAFWQDAVCAGVLDSEFRAEPDAGFAGTMSSQNRAGVRLVNFASSPHMIRRSQRQVSRLNGDHLMLSLQLQAGRIRAARHRIRVRHHVPGSDLASARPAAAPRLERARPGSAAAVRAGQPAGRYAIRARADRSHTPVDRYRGQTARPHRRHAAGYRHRNRRAALHVRGAGRGAPFHRTELRQRQAPHRYGDCHPGPVARSGGGRLPHIGPHPAPLVRAAWPAVVRGLRGAGPPGTRA